MPVLQTGLAKSAAADYTIDQSLRFDRGGSPTLTKTFGSAGDRKTYTWSGWVKLGSNFSTNRYIFAANAYYDALLVGSDQELYFTQNDGSESVIRSENRLRDPSAWYHILVAVDTTVSSPSSDRIKLYINGDRVTDFIQETYPSEDYEGNINNAIAHTISGYPSSNYFDGYLAEVYFIDGTALDASSFGETDSATGQWKPIDASDLTFGTNGFYQKYSATELAASFEDTSEDWTRTLSASNYFGSGSGSTTLSTNTTYTVANKNGSYDGDMYVAEYGNLTVDSGVTVTTDQPCRGLLMYVNGDLTLNGTISMTARGALADPTASGGSDSAVVNANGIQLPMLTNGGETLAAATFAGCGDAAVAAVANGASSGSGTIFTIERAGASGGAGQSYGGTNTSTNTPGTDASDGTTGQSGGGGGGSVRRILAYTTNVSGAGVAGTCFSGGGGGGGSCSNQDDNGVTAGSAVANGGAGGSGNKNGGGPTSANGGAGNPGGAGASASAGGDGTGGLLIIIVKGDVTIGAAGSAVANGVDGGTDGLAAGGGSGGGNLLLLSGGDITNSGTVEAAGASSGSGSTAQKGGAGGDGSVQVWPPLTNPSDHTITANGDVTNTRAEQKVGDSSIKFDGTGDYLTVPSSSDFNFGTGDFTLEFWAYFNVSGNAETIWMRDQTSANRNLYVQKDANDKIAVYVSDDGSNWPVNITTASAVSIGAWVHIAVVRNGNDFDTYINGTSDASTTNTLSMYASTSLLLIGIHLETTYSSPLNAYLDEIRLSDSARYTTTFTPSTTEFTADSNTMLLIHSDWDGGLGGDSSGNDNDFAPTNLVATDQMVDSPTNNFCTINPVANSKYAPTVSEGNLKHVGTVSVYTSSVGTIAMSSGKWYAEAYVNANTGTGNSSWLGLVKSNTAKWMDTPFNETTGSIALQGDGQGWKDAGTTTSDSSGIFTDGDIVSILMNFDDGEVKFWVNGSAFSYTTTFTVTEDWVPCVQTYNNGNDFTWNFGQDSSFAGVVTAQGNQDGNGIGDFYYEPPTDFLALCSSNLPSPEIALPTDHFSATIWAGDDSSSRAITTGVDADFVWYKDRTGTESNSLYDSVRGAQKRLISNSTDYERTRTNGLQSFDSTGFTVGSDTECNGSGNNYVAWNWKAGGAAVSNTDGDITSSVSANTTAGFSIVSYEGNSTSGATIGHGLSSAPELVICKERETAGYDWLCYAEPIGATKNIRLNLPNAAATSTGFWNDTAPSASVFTVGNNGDVNISGKDIIAYCFHSVEGYSKVGSYVGNGDADGTFVYTGMKPAFLLVKNIPTAARNWFIFDSARDTYNIVEKKLYPNLTNAEADADAYDFVSNGFKVRSSDANWNTSGESYLYLAFSESPFKTSNAR